MRKATFILAALVIAAAALWAHAATPSASQAAAADYATEFDRSQNYAGARTQENLDRIKKALAVPQTRLAALRELIDFAGLSAYQVGSVFIAYPDGSGNLRLQAAQAAHAAADDDTILQALNGSDPLLVFWGIFHFTQLKDAQASLPTLKKIVQGKDETLRSQAAEFLRTHGETAFLQDLARTEKSPYVLDQMLFAGNPAGARAFNARLCDLLKDADPAVRKEAINCIGSNWGWAAARQIHIDASLMDELLACAQTGRSEASDALDAFRMYANQKGLPDAAAAAKWWNTHRSDWELARFPRFQQPNGEQIVISIQTTGQVGGTPAWQASIALENRRKADVWVNLTGMARLSWEIIDAAGQRVPLDTRPKEVAPNWVDMQPGQSITQVSPIVLPADGSLKPGRYTLHAWLNLNSDYRGLPPKAPLLSGQLPLPTITVEVVGQAGTSSPDAPAPQPIAATTKPALSPLEVRIVFPGSLMGGKFDAQARLPEGCELLTLHAPDTTKIVALFGKDSTLRADAAARPALVYFYGNAEYIAGELDLFNRFRALGFNVIMVDYPGYGMSGGSPSEAGCYAAADAAYDYLLTRKDVDHQRIVAAGRSLGAAVAIDLASRRKVAGLVSFSAFTSIDDMHGALLKRSLGAIPVNSRFDNLAKIAAVSCPIFMAHGTQDLLVPPEMLDRLSKSAKSKVTILRVAGAGHNDVYLRGGDSLFQRLQTFVNGLSDVSPTTRPQ